MTAKRARAGATDTARQIRKLKAENKRLTDAIRWALGEIGDFPPITREQLEMEPCPKYYWRTELRRRAFGDQR